MNKFENNIFDLRLNDFLIALSLLTRIPINIDHNNVDERSRKASWAYPLVGALVGAIAALTANILNFFGLPVTICTIMALLTMVALTGGIHEDGLSDSADGLGGGTDKDSILKIMKDSRIGSFGTIALVLIILGRYGSMNELMKIDQLFWPLVAAGAVSRVPMVGAMVYLKPARNDGLSVSVGAPPKFSFIIALIIGILSCVLVVGILSILVLLGVGIITIIIFYIANEKISGQTGDVLGASQQFAELIALSIISGILIIN